MAKKEKITYIDDGRTIADMSGVRSPLHLSKTPSRSTAREKWGTFWAAFKMMLLPTLVFSGAMLVLYVVLYLIFSAA
ncbi:MAG: hypothetical protein IJ448_05230 [Oscillospiraceae bacterium]|nr:hypothetical protein [Oscillospiraceae bacterium]